MVRVTADTNIYISALNFGWQPDKLLELARAGDIQLSISDDIVAELRHVLRDKIRWTEDAIALAIERLGDFTEHVEPKQRIDAVKEDPTDNRILECAVAGASDYIGTGDKHLLNLVQFAGAKITKPASFLDIHARRGPTR